MEKESKSRDDKTAKLLNEQATVAFDEADGAETEVDQSSSRCGILGSASTLCQKNPLTFTLASSPCFLTQVLMVVFTISQITFLEKQFGFSTSQTSRILSVSQIGNLCIVLPAGYVASRVHVPRAMTLVAVLFGLASVFAGLPHFIFPSSSASFDGGVRNTSASSAVDVPPAFCWVAGGERQEMRCQAVREQRNQTSDSSEDTEAVYNPRAYPVYVFLIICQVIRGTMGAVSFPMFAQYIETNARKTDTGYYMGIVASVAMVGPAVAFLGGGAISKLHVSLKPTDMDPTHPEWVGAWWLGFLIFGTMAALAPVFVCRFPRRLAPCTPPLSSSPSSDPSPSSPSTTCTTPCSDSEGVLSKGVSHHRKPMCLVLVRRGVLEVRGFLLSLVRLLVNPVYVLLVIATCCNGFSMNGTYIFLPKYMQDQFQLPAWKSNYIMGGAELAMGTTGFLVAGWVTKRFKLSHRNVYKLLIGVESVSTLLVVGMMLVGCPQATLIGQPGYLDPATSNNCSLACACPDEVFPVCDRESSETFFSPCHAGCLNLHDGVYVNCTCTSSGRAYPGECMSDCSAAIFFSVIFFLMIFAVSMIGPLHYIVTVRSVPQTEAGPAIAFNTFLGGIAAFLIGPLIFGGLIDSFCDHWKMPCGVQGQCSVYNKDRFRVQMHLYSIVSMVLAVVCFLLSFLLYVCFPRLSKSASHTNIAQEKNVQSQGAAKGKIVPQPPCAHDPQQNESKTLVRDDSACENVASDSPPTRNDQEDIC